MFKVRTSAPTTWNRIWNNGDNGGISWCITGQPTNSVSNVLANCVGYACSRFNEIYNEETGYDGMKYRELCCNAEDFWTVADSIGLQKGQTPKAGAIMCWEGIGSLAGHVAIVERVDNENQVYTSESGWQSSYFWNSTRHKGSGNWGANGNYKFRGFIYNPAVVEYKWQQKWHLYDSNDKMLTGWHRVNGKWYYLDPNGIMQTGWIKLGQYWYLLGADGDMKEGWQKVNGKWYYLEPKTGHMLTGWVKVDGHWYYLSNNGDMQTGWLKWNGKWYYLNGGDSGRMLTGWQKINGKWYYLAPKDDETHKEGEMWIGWLKDNGKWYYLDPKDGYMYTGTHIIDGKTYHFDNSGALIE